MRHFWEWRKLRKQVFWGCSQSTWKSLRLISFWDWFRWLFRAVAYCNVKSMDSLFLFTPSSETALPLHPRHPLLWDGSFSSPPTPWDCCCWGSKVFTHVCSTPLIHSWSLVGLIIIVSWHLWCSRPELDHNFTGSSTQRSHVRGNRCLHNSGRDRTRSLSQSVSLEKATPGASLSKSGKASGPNCSSMHHTGVHG